jgi:hypothetical protein
MVKGFFIPEDKIFLRRPIYNISQVKPPIRYEKFIAPTMNSKHFFCFWLNIIFWFFKTLKFVVLKNIKFQTKFSNFFVKILCETFVIMLPKKLRSQIQPELCIKKKHLLYNYKGAEKKRNIWILWKNNILIISFRKKKSNIIISDLHLSRLKLEIILKLISLKPFIWFYS